MCHVSESLVANRPFLPPPLVSQNRRRPASPNGMGWGEDRHSVLGCEARWFTSDHTRVTPKEAQDGGQNGGPSEWGRLNRIAVLVQFTVYQFTVVYVCNALTYGMYGTF